MGFIDIFTIGIERVRLLLENFKAVYIVYGDFREY